MPRPSLAKGWKTSEDGKTFTLYLRKGLEWSDGHPMTADDFVFWFEAIYNDEDIVPTPIPAPRPQGESGRIVEVDDFTVGFECDVPFYLFEELMAGDTPIGGGRAVRQSNERRHGACAPAPDLEQFVPTQAGGLDAANAAAEAEGFDNWLARRHFEKDWTLNPELPVLGPRRTTRPIDDPTRVMERTLLGWAVDTEGNQLPCLDGVVMTLAENLELLDLRAISDAYDVRGRHVDIGKLPVTLENQAEGNDRVQLDLACNGADANFRCDHNDKAGPELATWLENAAFRRVLSLAIDRDQLDVSFWLGTAVPGSPAPAESLPYFPGPGWREQWSPTIPRIPIDQQDGIGTVGQSAALMGVRLVENKLGNVPGRTCIAHDCRTPGGAHPETRFYESGWQPISPGGSSWPWSRSGRSRS